MRPGATAPAGRRLPRRARIRSGREIRAVVRRGRRIRETPFDVFACRSERGHPRIAVIVPRYGRSAVARNRVRRRLREALRTGWLAEAYAAGRPIDLIVRAKPPAYAASYGSLRTALARALESTCEP